MTATAAANGKHRQSAAPSDTRTFRSDLGYVRPEKRTVVLRRHACPLRGRSACRLSQPPHRLYEVASESGVVDGQPTDPDLRERDSAGPTGPPARDYGSKGPLSPSFMLPRRIRSSVAAAPCGPGRLAAGLVVMLAVLPAVK